VIHPSIRDSKKVFRVIPKAAPPSAVKASLSVQSSARSKIVRTAYREGGRTKRASRLELVVKKLVNDALEGDVKSTDLLFKLRSIAENNNGARIEKIIVEDWVPDFAGQTGEQKTRAHARENEIDPTGFSEQTGSETTDPLGSVSASPKIPRDE
jgi:hypothetical protein